MAKVVVKFLQALGAYGPGDVAGFDEGHAGDLIAAKMAEKYTTKEATVRAARAEKLVPLRFVAPHGAYVPGDVAGFAPDLAKALIEAGKAEKHSAKAAGAAVAARAGADLVALTFIAHSAPYNPGDVAGFGRVEAAALVAAGVAVLFGGDADRVDLTGTDTTEGSGDDTPEDGGDDTPEGGAGDDDEPDGDEDEAEGGDAEGVADAPEAEPGEGDDVPEAEDAEEIGAPPAQGVI